MQIRSADTDVIILSIAHSEIIFSKGVNVLNVNCGSGKFYYVKSISVQLGADVCKVKFYPFFMHLLVAALFQVSTTMENDVDLLGSFLMKVYQQISKRVISLDIFRMNQFSK